MASRLASLCLHLFVILYAVSSSLVAGEVGCPPAEDVAPCVCYKRPLPRLVCQEIHAPSILERILSNSARYTFQEIHLQSSFLIFLPSDAFNKVQVKELYIQDCSLTDLFDKSLKSNSLYKLQLENTRMIRYSFKGLKNVTSLKTLIIKDMGVRVINSKFTGYFPSSLRQIIFNGTSTRKIVPGAFERFDRLDKLVVSFSDELENLTRDAFPQPFNARFLYFDNNNISYIPEDLFTSMPNLQFLTMRNNNITEIPQTAFGDRRKSIPYLRLDGNPLKCNCLMEWLLREKSEVIGGSCSTPTNLRGKLLKDLVPGELKC